MNQNIFLAFEIVVQQAVIDAGGLRDILDEGLIKGLILGFMKLEDRLYYKIGCVTQSELLCHRSISSSFNKWMIANTHYILWSKPS